MIEEGDGLMIGSALSNTKRYFKPNTVYNLIYDELTGEITMSPVGKSCLAEGHESESIIRVSWNKTMNDILSSSGRYLFLTEEEVMRELEHTHISDAPDEDY